MGTEIIEKCKGRRCLLLVTLLVGTEMGTKLLEDSVAIPINILTAKNLCLSKATSKNSEQNILTQVCKGVYSSSHLNPPVL